MYYPYFVTYIVAGLILSLGVFLWALKNGQFKDRDRARYLPLEDEMKTRPMGLSGVRRIELLVLYALVFAGLGLSAAALIFSLTQGWLLP